MRSDAPKVPFQTTLHVRDHCLCLYVQRAARVLARRFDEALRPHGLTNEQFSLLMSLNRP
ncbi:MAG: MarR family transcriptional regulator, partial [Bosea sp.]|nr:MarR family transcriptional regulator [Bosea sp. (in: a-proteobacteria)]